VDVEAIAEGHILPRDLLPESWSIPDAAFLRSFSNQKRLKQITTIAELDSFQKKYFLKEFPLMQFEDHILWFPLA